MVKKYRFRVSTPGFIQLSDDINEFGNSNHRSMLLYMKYHSIVDLSYVDRSGDHFSLSFDPTVPFSKTSDEI